MTITSVIGDLDGLDDELMELLELDKASVTRTMNFVVQSTAQRAKNLIRKGGRSGRLYFDGTHQASAPGEPPASLTGVLAGSIHFTKVTDLLSSVADVSVNADYASILEDGGFNEDGNYVAPRPFIRPAFQAAIERAEEVFDRELRKNQ